MPNGDSVASNLAGMWQISRREEDLEEGEDLTPAQQLARTFRPGTPTLPGRISQTRVGGAEHFVEGVGRGFLHPVQGLIPDMGHAESGAGIAGEFIGAGLSFIPLFKGAQVVAKGIGLTRTASILGARTSYAAFLGRNASGVKAARVAEGSLAFAGFETFSGPIEEAPQRFVRGLAEGAAFEGIFLSAALKWRARQPRYTHPAGFEEAVEQFNVHPYALKIERFFSPTPEHVGTTASRIRTLSQEPAEQLHASVARVADRFMHQGMLVLPSAGSRSLDDLTRVADDLGFKSAVFETSPGSFEVLLVNPNKSVLKATTKALDEITSGQEDALQVVIRALKKDYDDVGVEIVDYLKGGTTLGQWSPGYPESLISLARNYKGSGNLVKGDVESPIMLSTLFHEITHHISATKIARKIEDSGGILMNPGDVMPLRLTELFNIPEGSLKGIRDEFALLVEESVTNLGRAFGKSNPRKWAKSQIKSDPAYFRTDTEAVAWAAEVLYVDPARARELAPRASRLIGGLIARESPHVRAQMSEGARLVFDSFKERWVRSLSSDDLTIFTRGAPEASEASLRQFGKRGFFEGLHIFVDGKDAEYLAHVGKSNILVRMVNSGKTRTVAAERVQRPLLPRILERDEAVLREVSKVVDDLAENGVTTNLAGGRYIEVALRDLTREESRPIRHGFVEVTDYETATSLREWRRTLTDEERRMWDELVEDAPELMGPNHPASNISDAELSATREIIALRDSPGLLLNDEGFVQIIPGRPSTVHPGTTMESQAFGTRVAGDLVEEGTSGVLVPNIDDQLKLALRQQGVVEGDLEYFLNVAKERFGARLNGLMDVEARQVKENVEVALSKTVDNLDEAATRSGLDLTDLEDGRVVVRDAQSKSIIGVASSRSTVDDFVQKAGIDESGPPIVDVPGGNGAGGGGLPPKPQAQIPQGPGEGPLRNLGKGGGLVDATTMFGSLWTAMENFAKTAERRGFGQVYTKVFLPTQRAILTVDRELAEVKRKLLGGVSFSEHLEKLGKTLGKVKRERQETVTRYVEYMAREEIAAPGGLLQRGMNTNEIRVARQIEAAGLAHDIPRLMSTDRLIKASMKSEEALQRQIDRLRKIRGTPERDGLLAFFENLPTFKTFDEAADALGLTDAEKKVIGLIRDSTAVGPDDFSIFAVSRYASARPLGKGFKTGRAQFASEQNMTGAELQAAKLIDDLMEEAFALSNMDSKRQVGGYWPHMRMWAQHGYSPTNVPGLPKDMVKWSHAKFRSGELDVYNMDPLQTSYKYVRSLLMNQHFDPLLPAIRKELAATGRKSPRVKDILSEYVHELQGRPHESFRRVQSAIEEGLLAMTGKLPPENLVSNITNSLAALAAAAAIPFRPALIIRNWFESSMKIAPRMGVKHYLNAVRYVTDPATRREAYELAKRAQAISVGPQRIKSIHASTELFGPGAGKLNYKMERMLEKGFEWYQHSDDWGRAIAFHAQRFRLLEHHGDFMKGKITLDQFLQRSKALTYDPLDVRIAEQAIERGDIDGAINHLGFILARETMNRYGHANHPSGWNSIYGRLLGQFGTWPIQYKDFLMQGLTRGTTKDRMEFAAIHLGVSGGMIAGGSAVGLNLQSWVGFPSLAYTGGPFADLTIDVAKSISGSDSEKAMARRNLYSQIPVLGWIETGRPNSIFVPGSYLLGDIVSGIQADTPLEGLMEAGGFNVMRPEQKSALDWITSF